MVNMSVWEMAVAVRANFTVALAHQGAGTGWQGFIVSRPPPEYRPGRRIAELQKEKKSQPYEDQHRKPTITFLRLDSLPHPLCVRKERVQ
jgi:hypothetical protein